MKDYIQRWYAVLRSLLSRRARAQIRAEVPILVVLAPVVLGQMLGLFLSLLNNQNYWFGSGCLLATLLWYRSRAGLLILAGIVSISLSVGPRISILPKIDQSILAQVITRPRFIMPGEVSLGLRAVGYFENGKVKYFAKEFSTQCRGIDLPWRNAGKAERGDFLIVRANWAEPENSLNPFSYPVNLRRQGYSATCKLKFVSRSVLKQPAVDDSLRQFIIKQVSAVGGKNEDTGLFLSMSIGIRDTVSKVVEDAFKRTGLAHLLVVSGYQVTLVYVALTLVFSQLLARSSWLCAKIKLKAWASGAAVLGALAFVAICGVESSSARAGIAAIFLACAHALERGGGLVQAVGVSALALMILDPGCFLSPGVQLTYAALIGICLGHRESDGPIIGFLRVCLTATVCSSVTVAIWFNQISIIGLVLNPLLGTPAALVSCNFGLAATILLLSGIDANGWILQHVVNLTAWFKQLILVCSDLPWAALALEGAGKFVVVSFLVCLVLAIFRSRLEEYLLDRGLYLG